VAQQPAGQTCVVTNGSGTVGSGAVTNVAVACGMTVAGSWGGYWYWNDTPGYRYSNVNMQLVQSGSSVTGPVFTDIANTIAGTVNGASIDFTVNYPGRVYIDLCSGTLVAAPTGTQLQAACIGYYGTPSVRDYTLYATSHLCAPSREACALTCVPLQTDAMNCGACGNVCGGGQVCNAGQCVAGNGTDVSGVWNAIETVTECGFGCGSSVGTVHVYQMAFVQDSAVTFHGTWYEVPVRGSTNGTSIAFGFDDLTTYLGPAQGQCIGTVSGSTMDLACDEYILSSTGLQLNGRGTVHATK
jgi:hypothetical protein